MLKKMYADQAIQVEIDGMSITETRLQMIFKDFEDLNISVNNY